MSASSFSSFSEPDIITYVDSAPPSPTSQHTLASAGMENSLFNPPELKQVAPGSSPLPVVSIDADLASVLSDLPKDDAVSEPDKPPKSFKFFFPDGNVIFLVEDTLYRLHRYLFIRHSSKFTSEFPLHDSENDTPIKLDAIDKQGFEALLSILYPLDFTRHHIQGVTSWISVLDIATEWGFESIRELAIQSLAPIISPVDQVVFGEKYAVEAWLFPGFRDLCSREESLTLDEGRRLGLENVITIDCARQEIRDQTAARSTTALTTSKCLACNASDIYTSTPPAPHSQKKYPTCPLCDVQRGKLSLAEISQQVEWSIPRFAVALEARLQAERAEAEMKVMLKMPLEAAAMAEAEAKAKAEAMARLEQEWEKEKEREKEMEKLERQVEAQAVTHEGNAEDAIRGCGYGRSRGQGQSGSDGQTRAGMGKGKGERKGDGKVRKAGGSTSRDSKSTKVNGAHKKGNKH